MELPWRRNNERWIQMGYTFFLFHYLPCSSVFGLRKAMDLLSGRYLVESVVFKSLWEHCLDS